MKSAMNQICSLLNPDNTMTVNRLLAHAVGIPAAVVYTALISKYVYYEQNELIAEDGWFYSTVSDLEESTTLGIKAQRSAIAVLVELGLIKCEYLGMPKMRYFLIVDSVDNLWKVIKKGRQRIDKIHEEMIARKTKSKGNKIQHHRPLKLNIDDTASIQHTFNVESVEKENYGSEVFNSDMLKAVGTIPCECPSALSSESRTALSSERPSALASERLVALTSERLSALPCESPPHDKTKEIKPKLNNPKEKKPKLKNPKKENLSAGVCDQSYPSYQSGRISFEAEVFNNSDQSRAIHDFGDGTVLGCDDYLPADGERPFTDILRDIGLDFVLLFGSEKFPESEADMRDRSDENRMIGCCHIPDQYCYRPKDLETALRYVTSYSYFCNPEKDFIDPKFVKFHNAFIGVLAEMLTEDEYIRPNGRKISRYRLLERLNAIIKANRIYDFLDGFRESWEKILDSKEVHHKKRYMKTCLWNYLVDIDLEEFNSMHRDEELF